MPSRRGAGTGRPQRRASVKNTRRIWNPRSLPLWGAVALWLSLLAWPPALPVLGAASGVPVGSHDDLLIVHGHIVDGSGSPWFEGSVAVRGGKIRAVGRLADASGKRVIDATGLVVVPGFIDLHSHSD